MMVLNVMGIPSRAIVDLDYALKEGIRNGYLDEHDQDIVACKNELTAMILLNNNVSIGADGWPARDKNNPNSLSAADSFALLAQQPNVLINISSIASKFKARNIWIWKKGTIENHLNLSGKTEAIWAAFANSLENNSIENVLPNDHQEIKNCVSWLLED